MHKKAFESLKKLASEQRGLFSVEQAGHLGVNKDQIHRAFRAGRLRRVRRSVYAMEGVVATSWEPIIAAALAASSEAVVSHRSAALVHNFEYLGQAGPVELTIPVRAGLHLPGVVGHRTCDLTAADVVRRRNISVTSPCRTLIDLAGRLGPELTEKTLDEGLIVRRWTVRELQDCLGRARPNLEGRTHLERALTLRGEGTSADSALEMKVYRALKQYRPIAHHEVVLDGCVYVLDAAWPELLAAVEIIGRSHRLASRSAFERERRKLSHLANHGWRVTHLTAAMSVAEMRRSVEALLQHASCVSDRRLLGS